MQAAVDQLNYRPNLVARSMRTRRTGRLAVVVPTLAYSPARMLAGASAAAHAAAYAVEVLAFERGPEERAERVPSSPTPVVDGIVSFAPVLASLELRLPSRTPIIASADFDDEMRGIGELADASALVDLIRGPAERDHRRFLHITGDLAVRLAQLSARHPSETVASLGLSTCPTISGKIRRVELRQREERIARGEESADEWRDDQIRDAPIEGEEGS